MTAAARQLELAIEPAPRDAAELLARLRALGLRDTERCRLTSNRTVMVSFRAGELRVHRAYLEAPRDVHEAIVRLVQARPRAARAAARRIVLGYHVPEELSRPRRARPAAPLEERDARALEKLRGHHAELNARHFGGALSTVEIRLSAQMRSRLGHYSPPQGGAAAHIAISRRHLRRNGWTAALETLLHEMIHQWQHESGLPLDHRRHFRTKARAVGLPPTSRAPAAGRAPSAERPSFFASLHTFLGTD